MSLLALKFKNQAFCSPLKSHQKIKSKTKIIKKILDKDFLSRVIALITLGSFLSQQCVFAQSPDPNPPAAIQNSESGYTPVITPEAFETRLASGSHEIERPFQPETLESTNSFMEDESSLREIDSNSQTGRVSVEEAQNLLREDFAYAGLLESLTEDDLKLVLDSGVETGLAVIAGETVLFTSGSRDEIRTVPSAERIFHEASLVAHIHPRGEQSGGPSSKDIELSSQDGEEYVVTTSGVYVYNRSGVLNEGRPISYSEFISRVGRAKNQGGGVSNVRSLLNQFIAETDRLNQEKNEGVLFRSGGTISPNANLTSSDISLLPRGARANLIQNFSPDTRLIGSDSEWAGALYDAQRFQASPGIGFLYDDLNTPLAEWADFSSLATLRFGIRTSAERIGFEIQDALGHRDSITLLTSWQSWQEEIFEIDRSLLSNSIDWSQIRQINFLVEPSQANPYLNRGILWVHAQGLTPQSAPSYRDLYPYLNYPWYYRDYDYGYRYYWRRSQWGFNSKYYFYPYWNYRYRYPYLRDLFPNSQLGLENFSDLPGNPNVQTYSTGNLVNTSTVLDPERVNLSYSFYPYRRRSFGGFRWYNNRPYGNLNLSVSDSFDFSQNSVLVVGLMGDTDRVELEVRDSAGRRVKLTLSGVTRSEENFYAVDLSYYSSFLNLSSITSLHFQAKPIDAYGNWYGYRAQTGSVQIRYGFYQPDLLPPQVTRLSPLFASSTDYTLALDVDGTPYSENLVLQNGLNSVIRSFADRSGNITVYNDSILLDQDMPTGSVEIDSGDQFTAFASVSLNLSGSDPSSGVDSMRFSMDGGASWTDWEPFSTSKTLALPSGDGPKEVFAEIRDLAGNVARFSDQILLDTTAPQVVLTSPQVTNQTNYALVYTVDGVFQQEQVVLSNEGINIFTRSFTDPAGFTTTVDFQIIRDMRPPQVILVSPTLTNSSDYTLTCTVDGISQQEQVSLVQEGINTVSRTFTDAAGNTTAIDFQITRDTTPPRVALTSPTVTNQTNYTLEYTVDGISWQESVLLAQEGANTFLRTFTDLAGNTTTADFVIARDIQTPQVVLTSPALTNQSVYTLIYTVDGVSQQEQVTLAQEGENTVTRTFTDAAGNSTTVNFTITLDTMPPQAVLTSPALTNSADYTLIYSVDGISRQEQVVLTQEGGNTISRMFTDAAGNSTSIDFLITRDTTAPQVVLTSAAVTNQTNYTIAYTVDGVGQQESVILNQEGPNVFTRTFTDPAGNSTAVNFTITRDTVPPQVALTSPQLTNSVNYALAYTIDGVSQQEQVVLTQEGQNTLSRTFTDAAGNAVQLVFNVTLDSIPPAVILTSPSYVYSSNYTLAYTVDGVSKSAGLTLNVGSNTYNYSETDAAGNITAGSFSITFDPIIPPASLRSAPYTDASTYTLEYSIGGVVQSEAVGLVLGENVIRRNATLPGNVTVPVSFTITRVPTLRDSKRFAYDADGNLIKQLDSEALDINYRYDSLNQLTAATFADGSSFSYSYDGNGNLTGVVDAGGTAVYTYDNLNQLTQVTYPDGKTLHYQYDSVGNISGITYPEGTVVSYAYDVNDRLSIVTRGTEVTSYQYNAAGDLTQVTLPNGVKALYGYDADGRLISVRYEDALGALVQSFGYQLDANGNRTQMIETTPQGSKTTGYVYDKVGRLIRVTDPSGKIVSYAYDGAGNRLSQLEQADAQDPGILTTYTYEVENRLGSLARINQATLQTLSDELFFYDPRGNLVAHVYPDRTVLYTYDQRNLLVRASDGINVTEYEYDGLGNRIAKIANGVRTNYVLDINSPISQVLQELDASGNVQKSYVMGLSRISQFSGTNSQYYLQDGLGSTCALLDSAGAASGTYDYDAFGNLTNAANLATNNFTFTGEQFDSETGLVYLRARYYDPATGRFLSKDPVLGSLSETQSLNRYPYVQNNPVNFIDPLGLERDEEEEWFYSPGMSLQNPIRYGQRLNDESRFVKWEPSLQTEELIETTASEYLDFVEAVAEGPEGLAEYAVFKLYEIATGETPNDTLSRKLEELKKKYFSGGDPPGGSDSSGSELSSSFGNGSGGLNASSRGGVLINQSANLVGLNLSSITGATYDPASGQFILLGTDSVAIPDIRTDDLVEALRAVFGSITDAGVTIDPPLDANGNPIPNPPNQLVRYFGGVENTDLGWVVFEADRMMKSLAAGKDNITGQSVTSTVPGFQSMLDRWASSSLSGTASSRFWFVPEIMELQRSNDNQSFQFTQAKIKLLTEDMLIGGGAVDPEAEAFAQHFTDNYDLYAQEFPIFERLRQVMKAVALARFIKENNIPVDFSWLDDFQAPPVTTPDTTPTVTNSKTWTSGNTTYTVTVEGGVSIEGANSYLSDSLSQVSSLANSTRTQRSSLEEQSWQVASGPNTYNAVALSLTPVDLAGGFRISEEDLVLPTPGDLTFGISRFYDSFEGWTSPFGYGWKIDPYAIKFEKLAYEDFAFQSGTTLNGLREGKARVIDRATGEEVVFRSNLSVTDTGSSYLISGLSANGTTTFSLAENPDGSSLVMNTDKTYEWVRQDESRVKFANDGKILQETDRFGKWVKYNYTGNRITSITDSQSRSITLTYDTSGRIIRADGPAGWSVIYAYDAAGNLASRQDGRTGLITRYSYDANHRLIQTVDPFGDVDFENIFDTWGTATSRENERGNLFTTTYDRASRRETVRNEVIGGNIVREYDTSQRLVRETDYLGSVWSYSYTGTNREPSTVMDPKGHQVSLQYDTNGHLTRVTDPDNLNSFGYTLAFSYDSQGHVTWMRDARGVQTGFVYDTSGNLTEMRENSGVTGTRITKYAYDAAGNLTSVTDANNRTENFIYDTLGNLLEERDALGSSTAYSYDGFYRLTGVTDALGRGINVAYNNLDQITQIQTSLGVINYSYDAQGNLNLVTDAGGNQTTYTHDPTTGDLLQVIDAEGNLVRYTYDVFGRIASMTDTSGNTTYFEYDELGRVIFIGDRDVTPPLIKAKEIRNLADRTGEVLVTATEELTIASIYLRESGQTTFQEYAAQIVGVDQMRLSMSNLKPATTYEYEVRLMDRAGNIFRSETFSFSTLPDTFSPVILDNRLTLLSSMSASFRLEAGEPLSKATLHVINTVNGTSQEIVGNNPWYQGYTVQLGWLSPSATYDYYWEVWDQLQNLTITPTVRFTMPADSFFIENRVLGASPYMVIFHVNLAEQPIFTSRIYYRPVGTTTWSSTAYTPLIKEGDVTWYPYPFLMSNTEYEYQFRIDYWSTYINPVTGQPQQYVASRYSQIQTFRT